MMGRIRDRGAEPCVARAQERNTKQHGDTRAQHRHRYDTTAAHGGHTLTPALARVCVAEAVFIRVPTRHLLHRLRAILGVDVWLWASV